MVSFDRLIYIYCILQEACTNFFAFLNTSVADIFTEDLLGGISNPMIVRIVEFFIGVDLTMFELVFGAGIIAIITYTVVKWAFNLG